ncbi:ArsR/SmtB family transcription factor [Rhodococcus artemisiae]|uniref:Helix-turn-helix domain-containing protein n=1 Tax=Rhodococcus artemisiae TaxID=714159 RepID=A0ABU7LCK5_9NOCA|nr:helix-turn-helix domain-containing protein [Rhodococcus artemisiae]MEE2059268.1 helix-turn-helix domain-containing protein [Rhodococcus artemisiae]
MNDRPTGSHEDRIADLERRVRLLENSASPEESPGSASPGAAGSIGYQGTVALSGTVSWTIEYDAAATLDLDGSAIAAVLDALGSPARLAIVRTLLRGPATAGELQEATALSSPGRLYHHLRTLSAAHVVEQQSRNRYHIPPAKVVPLLVLSLAAADVAEQL